MSKLIFVNLPVTDLDRSIAFYQVIGATRNPQFSDETAACMVLSDTIHVMLLTHDKFRQFTPKPIADAHATSQVLLCISADSRAGVDEIAEAALNTGGHEAGKSQDYGFMYSRSFADPDGHIWEPMWMDVSAFADQQAAPAAAATQPA